MTEHAKHWATIWSQALKAMPRRKVPNPDTHSQGKQGALARCLGLPLYSSGGHYIGHKWAWHGMTRGVMPSDPKVCSDLMKLAGPHGHTLALIRLKRLGLAHRYVD